MSIRLVQLQHKTHGRKVAYVQEPVLELLTGVRSIYELAQKAISQNGDMSSLVMNTLAGTEIDYDAVYNGRSEWTLLPSFDHPGNPSGLMISGTGLTHKASAENRQKMHRAKMEKGLTDSMKMYLMGVEGGHPENDKIGVQPEWFYKGNASVLRAHDMELEIPPYGNDGGEEPEIAGVYINDKDGIPWRVGFTTANEFSDHVMERKNYLYLAPSKIRNCAIGPELVVTSEFKNISGKVSIIRNKEVVWAKDIKTGAAHMCHSLANMEYHHFKYANHALPGQAHVHFFGADAFSFGEGVVLEEGDVMEVFWEAMGRPLRNSLRINKKSEEGFTLNYLK